MQEVWKDSKQNDLEDPEQYTLHDEIKIWCYQDENHHPQTIPQFQDETNQKRGESRQEW